MPVAAAGDAFTQSVRQDCAECLRGRKDLVCHRWPCGLREFAAPPKRRRWRVDQLTGSGQNACHPFRKKQRPGIPARPQTWAASVGRRRCRRSSSHRARFLWSIVWQTTCTP